MVARCSCDVCTALHLAGFQRKRADRAGWLNVKCCLRIDPLFKSLPQEKKDSLQQNGAAGVRPETIRLEAAEYRAAHEPEAAEYRAAHKSAMAAAGNMWHAANKLEVNRKARLRKAAERIERRETGLMAKPSSDKAIENAVLRKQVYTAAFSAEGAELGDQPGACR